MFQVMSPVTNTAAASIALALLVLSSAVVVLEAT
jgi:hypothetical protein